MKILSWSVAFATLCLLGAGCAGPGRYTMPDEGETASPQEALATAERYAEERPEWAVDCSGFVRACYHSREMTRYAENQPPGRNMAQSLFRYCTDNWKRRKRFAEIQPGDILIFDKTYDANHDGHIDAKDRWTHAGLAVSFEDGLLVYLDASEGRKGPKIRRRSFSIKKDGKNEGVATDPATGRRITHRETFNAAFGPE